MRLLHTELINSRALSKALISFVLFQEDEKAAWDLDTTVGRYVGHTVYSASFLKTHNIKFSGKRTFHFVRRVLCPLYFYWDRAPTCYLPF